MLWKGDEVIILAVDAVMGMGRWRKRGFDGVVEEGMQVCGVAVTCCEREMR